LKNAKKVELVYKLLDIDLYITHVFEVSMTSSTETGRGSPNKTTKVNTSNGNFTIVASVRMHSDGGEYGHEEDLMYCLAVNNLTGELVTWDRYWIEERGEMNGWGGGTYQPYREGQPEAENNAINRFKDRIEYETSKTIARALNRQLMALEDKKRKGGEKE